MLFPETKRVVYKNNPILEVVIQVRFPTILSINAYDPVDFQEKIRADFPKYECKIEPNQQVMSSSNACSIPPILNNTPNKNHNFYSKDGKSRVNLTSAFIAFSTCKYERWEEFIGVFNNVIESFIEVYNPSYCERIGIRYIDAFSRKTLGVSDTPWNKLIKPHMLGMMAEEDEESVIANGTDFQMTLDSSESFLKVHAGTGCVNDNPETQFIIDSDFYCSAKTEIKDIIEISEHLHGYSTKFIRGCIEDKLHEAMEPKEIL